MVAVAGREEYYWEKIEAELRINEGYKVMLTS